MRVSGLDQNDDWRFGKGRAVYKRRSDAIAQNVATRLRSFTNDWFADVGAGIPWIELLGNKGTERRILRAIERTVLQTEGVRKIDVLRIIRRDTARSVTIELSYTDVYDRTNTQELPLPL